MTDPSASGSEGVLVLVRSVGAGDAARLVGELAVHPELAARSAPGAGDVAGRLRAGLERAVRDVRDVTVGGRGLDDEGKAAEAVVRAQHVSRDLTGAALAALADAVRDLAGTGACVEPTMLPVPVLGRLVKADAGVRAVLVVGDPLAGVAATLAADPTALGPARRAALAEVVADAGATLLEATWRRADRDASLLALRVAAPDGAGAEVAEHVRGAARRLVADAGVVVVEVEETTDEDAARAARAAAVEDEVGRAVEQWRTELDEATALTETAGGAVLLLTHHDWRADPDAAWRSVVSLAGVDDDTGRPATLPDPPPLRTGGLDPVHLGGALHDVRAAAAALDVPLDAAPPQPEPVESLDPHGDEPPAPTAPPRRDDVTVYRPQGPWSMGYVVVWRDIVRNAVAHRGLIWQLFRRDFFTPYRTSYLGMSWLVLAPLITIVQWLVVRSNGVLDAGDIGVPYPVYVLLGTTMWTLFLGLQQAASDTLRSAGGLLQQVRFPRETLIFKQIGQQLATSAVALAVSLVVLAGYGIAPAWQAVALPFVLVPLVLIATAIGLLISMVVVVAVDLDRIMRLLWSLAMWLSPVVYTLEQRPGTLADVARWNPLTYLVLAPRSLILDGTVGDPVGFAASSALAVVLFVVAGRLFFVSEPQLVERLL